MQQRQIEGSKESVAGSNLSGVTGLVYAGIITAAIATVIFTLASNGFLQAAAANFPVLNGIVENIEGEGDISLSCYTILTFMCPIGQIITAWISYQAYKNFVCEPLFAGVRAIIFWLAS